MLDFEHKKQQLSELYTRYAEVVQPYLASAVCGKGCADCCINVGSIDITTLEGLIIHKHLKELAHPLQKELNKKLKLNRRTKQDCKFARCAFLLADNSCIIYPLRPFSCRRLYSIRRCGETGPTVHRQAWDAAEQIRVAIQKLDDTGYVGHISYILQLMNDSRFLKVYLAGNFSPQEIRSFSTCYHLSINRLATT
jgi:uncharacterized protein